LILVGKSHLYFEVEFSCGNVYVITKPTNIHVCKCFPYIDNWTVMQFNYWYFPNWWHFEFRYSNK